MTSFDILTALRQKDYHTANQGFARVMQEKLADRLAVEKRDVTQQALTESTQLVRCKKCNKWINVSFGADSPSVHQDASGTKTDPRSPGDHDDICDVCDYGDYDGSGNKPRLDESVMSAHEVQRVYDEVGDVGEVELLCGITGLRVNENGQVITYITESRELTANENRGADFAENLIADLKATDLMVHRNTARDNSFGPCVSCDTCEESIGLDESSADIRRFIMDHKGCGGQFFREAIDRPNSSGQGYDDDYMHNPYHGVIRKYGYEYSHSTPVRGPGLGDAASGGHMIHHTYTQGTHTVSVWGNKWSTSTGTASGKMFQGGHPNTARAEGDLERHLRDKARRYGLTESNGGDYRHTKFRDEIAKCPQCGILYPFKTMVDLSHMGSDESPCCGVLVQRTGKQGQWQWTDDSSRSADAHNIATLVEAKMQYDNDGRINKDATYKVVTAQGTVIAKGLSKDDAKNQAKNYHDATGFPVTYQTESFTDAVSVMSGWDTCDMCEKAANWRGKDPKTGVVLASACRGHKDVVKNALVQKLQGVKHDIGTANARQNDYWRRVGGHPDAGEMDQ